MDIFALTSISENVPNTLLEAMASGLPIVATDVGDVRYLLDGENGGIIIKPKDIDAIADGIEYFLKNKQAARDKGSFVRERTEELFNLERMVSEYEKLYLDILGS
jgi:glycosyltransferase involved in cell wall biosynthesis